VRNRCNIGSVDAIEDSINDQPSALDIRSARAAAGTVVLRALVIRHECVANDRLGRLYPFTN